tara:strand:- start:149 stop:310 length:162 start_codon:yes stop_codon:yes gene_type:complete
MKVTIEDGSYKFSVETPKDIDRETFILVVQPVFDAVWNGTVQLIDDAKGVDDE